MTERTTDPLDLEALKERAHNYRFERDSEFVVTVLADLDRAIEIAEQIAEQARQDVLLLRDALTGNVRHDPALGATAHYEQHRQAQEGGGRDEGPEWTYTENDSHDEPATRIPGVLRHKGLFVRLLGTKAMEVIVEALNAAERTDSAKNSGAQEGEK